MGAARVGDGGHGRPGRHLLEAAHLPTRPVEDGGIADDDLGGGGDDDRYKATPKWEGGMKK
jgi:hypothetical protein